MEETEVPSYKKILYSIGWLSYSFVFNTMNSIVYAALFPKILRGSTTEEKFLTGFTTTNTITTLFSALTLPMLGTITDQLKLIKLSLVIIKLIDR
jgi:MFS-type transporter involved in bile tolerance (Atg22 family)